MKIQFKDETWKFEVIKENYYFLVVEFRIAGIALSFTSWYTYTFCTILYIFPKVLQKILVISAQVNFQVFLEE